MPTVPDLTVLIADDEVTIAKLYGNILVRAGFQVILAKDGREALDKARIDRPALILTDQQMPKMTGGEFLAALDEQGARTGPAILMTGDDSAKAMFQALYDGADDMVIKGESLAEMLKLARFWVGSGFKRLPELARTRALGFADDRAVRESFSLLGVPRVDEAAVSQTVARIEPELADLPEDYGTRLVERILLIARLSRLILDDANGPGQALRFPHLLIACLNRLNQPWVRDAQMLLGRFDRLAQDRRFADAWQQGMWAV